MHGQERLFTITLLLLFLGGNPANATVGFHPPVSYPVGPAPVAVVIGDFNGDGKPDLAVANHGDPSAGDDGNLSILLGNGDGTFQAAKTVVAGKNPASLVVADFEGDNRLDLAVVNSNDSLTLLLGKGDGTFQAPVAYATAPSPIALKVGDVNGDQRPDLIVLQGDPGLAIRGIVGIFLGNGDGSFQSRVDQPTGSYVHSLATFDVNNDQKLDLLMGAGIDGIETMLGNGDGTFLPGLYCRCGAQNGVSDSVSIGSVTGGRDFNGDGRMDLAAEYSEGRLSNNKLSFFLKEMVLLVNADGTFTPIDVGIDIPVKIDYSDPPRIFAEIADFDHDGRTDLALAMPTGLSVLFGNGDGSFQSVHFNSGPANATSIVAADLNGDGFPDLIMTNGFGNTASVMLSTTQPLPMLSITLAGNGSGTVSFGNFLCPDVVCSAPFDPGSLSHRWPSGKLHLRRLGCRLLRHGELRPNHKQRSSSHRNLRHSGILHVRVSRCAESDQSWTEFFRQCGHRCGEWLQQFCLAGLLGATCPCTEATVLSESSFHRAWLDGNLDRHHLRAHRGADFAIHAF
jgi:FG-GAP-like repeat